MRRLTNPSKIPRFARATLLFLLITFLYSACQNVPKGPLEARSLIGRWESERSRHFDITGISGTGSVYYEFIVDEKGGEVTLREFPKLIDNRRGGWSRVPLSLFGGRSSPVITLYQEWKPEKNVLEATRLTEYGIGRKSTESVQLKFHTASRGEMRMIGHGESRAFRISKKGPVPPDESNH